MFLKTVHDNVLNIFTVKIMTNLRRVNLDNENLSNIENFIYSTQFIFSDFNLLKTTHKLKTVISNIPTNNFEIPFSVRGNSDGIIFLCDKEQPEKSKCYWILIGAWHNTKSAIRKCDEYQIPKFGMYPDPPCEDFVAVNEVILYRFSENVIFLIKCRRKFLLHISIR